MRPKATQLKPVLEIFVDYYLQTMYTVDVKKIVFLYWLYFNVPNETLKKIQRTS